MAKKRHSTDRRDILNETERQVRQRAGYPDKVYDRSETVYRWYLFRDNFSCGSAYLHDEEPILTEFRDRNYSGLREPQSVKNYKPLQLFCRNAASLAAFFYAVDVLYAAGAIIPV
ncbi:hypothetical protein JYL57_003088 [Salmonella enterica subsp. enterica serovar Typhimurium]|uniref:hypothetical protein n=1 Tax=Salmonella enterica TaxID=28901 RepID=UPI00193D197F|nr:hypothetical protein [Salmonella enterica]EDW2062036.1 hypothetical protein [Salmonella enterica subsp. enterica serovar Oslo]EDY1998306.1 hypothetical protein [Salmonella enterica subsp. diarizonae]EHD9480832.1 hypothetical protein [Salmonella enterica subsp. enterica serovar Typhimurium]EEL2517536.1 hypothetical protein [Salmonella enterica]EIO3283089.1 hypothetical protein [Salmonella enterica]